MTEKIYSQNDVSLTAHIFVEDTLPKSYGRGLTFGINQVCRCCKSSDTQEIKDPVELRPWTDFFKTYEYRAYKCRSCGYMFSWYKIPK